LVRLHSWLADVLFWRDQPDQAIHIAEAGLALLGTDRASLEAALMNDRLAWCYATRGESRERRAFNGRNARFLERLPYSDELRPLYVNLFEMHTEAGEIEEASRWMASLEQRGEQHHDLTALGEVRIWQGALAANEGDFHGATTRLRQSLELLARTGDTKLRVWSLNKLGEVFLTLGDLPRATEAVDEGLAAAQSVGNQWRIAWALNVLGTVQLCQGALAAAANTLQKAYQAAREVGLAGSVLPSVLGRVHLAQGQSRKARREFQEAVTAARDPCTLALVLSGLEDACPNAEAFRGFCRRFREEHAGTEGRSRSDLAQFVQWFLEPTAPGRGTNSSPALHDEFSGAALSGWVWQDPFGDGSFTVGNGLVIRAANGRDLWEMNVSAPRLLQPASEWRAVQTICVPDSAEQPAIGGLLLWKDREHFLRLDRGTRGGGEISFQGSVGCRKYLIVGRGRLPVERVFLRLERRGRHVRGLCSADGRHWFAVGQAAFPVEDPGTHAQRGCAVGLHAIGNIDRTIYHGAFPEGTATRFESFQMWG
jgi:tetratricopeptide (TPR) repeat protein